MKAERISRVTGAEASPPSPVTAKTLARPVAVDTVQRTGGTARKAAIKTERRVALAPTLVATSAKLEGGGSIELRVDKQLQDVFGLIAKWESTCRKRGGDVQFCIGAGDLRRAVFGLPVTGPGDFELFVHFRGQLIQPTRLIEAVQALRDYGVDVHGDLAAILGEKKKIDVFFKDQRGLAEGGDYCGEFGFFDGMGDTSLNQLVYAPGDGAVYGTAANLAALRDGRITYTEMEKSKPLAVAKPITGIKKPSQYKDTILRMALRVIRLKIDLLLAPNPNRLRLDGTFTEALEGFERYFASCTPEDIAKYAIDDEAYLEQFCKIFRNRTNAELKTIHGVLTRDLGGTYAILKTLGLDVDLLCARRDKSDDEDVRERRAVYKNARYKILWPLIAEATMKVGNPFKVRKHEQTLIAGMSGHDAANVRPLPPALLERYEPRLAKQATVFDTLELDAQRGVVKKYKKALAFFAAPALKRAEEVELREKCFEHLALPAPSFGAGDKQTLLEWVTSASRPNAPLAVASAGAFNADAKAALFESIRSAREAGKTPVLFVDLDDTSFDYTTRVKRILDTYDRVSGTSWFADVRHFDLPRRDFSEFLHHHLGQVLSGEKLFKEVEKVETLLMLERNKPENVEADAPLEATRVLLEEAVANGAVVHYLSMRSTFTLEATRRALQGFPQGGVTLIGGATRDDEVDGKYPKAPGAAKQVVIEDYCRSHPNAAACGLIDNDPVVIRHVRKSLPGTIPVLAVRRHDPKQKSTDVFLALREDDLYRIHARV